jgi:hypothetical protein
MATICPLAQQGIACKHEGIQMPHPNIPNGAIVKDTSTFHGINKGPTTTRHMVCDDLHDQKTNIQEKYENIGSLEMTTVIAQHKLEMMN